MLYREGARELRVAAEFLAADAVVLECVSIRAWNPPHESEPVDRDRVARHVKEALEFDGLKVYVDAT